MLLFALAPHSTKPGDHVFVIVPKTKVSATGRRLSMRGNENLEVIEGVIDQLHYGWSHASSAYAWSCAIAQIVPDNNPLNGRYLQDVSVEDCFHSKEQATKELEKRKEGATA